MILMRKRKDYKELLGKKFNRWEVIEYSYYDTKSKKPYFLCKCECGKEKIVSLTSLAYNRSKSCGCIIRESMLEANGKRLRKCRLIPGELGFRILYSSYKHNAKLKNLEFSLGREEFIKITSSNCYYCGVSALQESVYRGSKRSQEYSKYLYNGIDRVDNAKGYLLDNVVPCCTMCNKAKRNISYLEFLSWVERLSSNIQTIKNNKKWL